MPHTFFRTLLVAIHVHNLMGSLIWFRNSCYAALLPVIPHKSFVIFVVWSCQSLLLYCMHTRQHVANSGADKDEK